MPKKKKRNPTYLVDIKETELKKKKNKKKYEDQCSTFYLRNSRI